MTKDAKQRVGGYAAYYDLERSTERATLLSDAESAALRLRRAQAALPVALKAAFMAGNTERDLARATGISQSHVHRLIGAHRRARRWRDALTDFAEYLCASHWQDQRAEKALASETGPAGERGDGRGRVADPGRPLGNERRALGGQARTQAGRRPPEHLPSPTAR